MLQDRRYKNRELQIMRLLNHLNVVQLKHSFYSTTEKNEVYLNLVLEYVSETVYRASRHYSRVNQYMPILYVQLYIYQVYNWAAACSFFCFLRLKSSFMLSHLKLQICRALNYIHRVIGVCHRDIKPQNLLVTILIIFRH